MEFYTKVEAFKNGVSRGKGVAVYQANNVLDALRTTVTMMEASQNLLSDLPSECSDQRVTVGPVLFYTASGSPITD